MPSAHKGLKRGEAKRLRGRWEAFVRKRGLNTTQQRDAIVDQFLRTTEHVSIDELLAQVRRRHKKIGYATVYRTLKLLVESGLAMQRQFGDGQARFEVAGKHHDHLICIECGLILEFEDAEIEAIQERIAKRLGGFEVLYHSHELFALCPKARGVPGGRCPNKDR